MRIFIALLLAASLAGCASTTLVTSNHPRLDPPSAVSMADCSLPANLPAGQMTQSKIELYWGLDRKHELECAKRHGILRDYIVARDSALAPTK